MSTPRGTAITTVALAVVLAGCVTPTPVPTPTATVSASPSPTPTAPDFTRPGEALTMVRKLISSAGSDRLLQVEITQTKVTVSVLVNGAPVTWAWRDGDYKQIDSDIMNVDQNTFSITQFDIDNVAELFRQAAVVAGSDSQQELQIVDSSAGEVMMSVSTLPESKTVFFYPDGRLLPILDFDTARGVSSGLSDVIGTRGLTLAVGVKSDLGAYLDYEGIAANVIVRRLRIAGVPTTITQRSEPTKLTSFAPSLVQSGAIWRVVQRARVDGLLGATQPWSVVIDTRNGGVVPRMYFSFGGASQVTDLKGQPIRTP